jgi:NAD-dependent SIR2 family protein deacetylase
MTTHAPADAGLWTDGDVDRLASLMRGRRTLVLCGAGCSTESGIPDYRSPKAQEKPRTPIQHDRFVKDAAVRRRYWARSTLGWPVIRDARPNDAHHALAELESRSAITGLITQNVDGLHHAAGNRNILELHGSLSRVRCLVCGEVETREDVQVRVLALNPEFVQRSVTSAPDGDADLDDGTLATFHIPECTACGGVLKPDVVFFGDNVVRTVVDTAWAMLADADVLLVVGSSLTVFSGFRFVKRAAEENKPVAIVNVGPTRGDELATLHIHARLGAFLPRLVRHFL